MSSTPKNNKIACGVSRRHGRTASLIALIATSHLLVGCTEPSTASTALEKGLVPRVIDWSKSSQDSLKLSDIFDLRPYDAVCIVPEYNCLNSIKDGAVRNVEEYHSSFGKCVPEFNTAIMITENNTAHAVVINRNILGFDVNFTGKCVKAHKAVFSKIEISPNGFPVSRLEER